MKKQIIYAFGATLVAAAFILSGFKSGASSLDELTVKAEASAYYCKPHQGTDCISNGTNNIYPNYIATDYPKEELEPVGN